jgi:hypothetical protein
MRERNMRFEVLEADGVLPRCNGLSVQEDTGRRCYSRAQASYMRECGTWGCFLVAGARVGSEYLVLQRFCSPPVSWSSLGMERAGTAVPMCVSCHVAIAVTDMLRLHWDIYDAAHWTGVRYSLESFMLNAKETGLHNIKSQLRLPLSSDHRSSWSYQRRSKAWCRRPCCTSR